jgi:glycosyltransferase A (GT-A) superfamily protein (DUF2064 family)
MAYDKKLGVVVGLPRPDDKDLPRAAPGERKLREAFLADLLDRLGKMKSISITVFYPEGLSEGPPELLTRLLSKRYITFQAVESGPEKPADALGSLFGGPNRGCVVISGDCPDLPVQYIKRAYSKLKHKDAVVGPTSDGRLYLFGLKQPAPGLLDGIDWDRPNALAQTVERIKSAGLTLSVLPLWYRADTIETLTLLSDLLKAKRYEKRCNLPATEAALAETLKSAGDPPSDD